MDKQQYGKAKRQIIIIPGIMGSKLKEQALTLWLPHVQAILEMNLYEKLKYNNKKPKENRLIADGLLGPFYGRLKTCLEDYALYVDEFAYDWRIDNNKHLEDLEKLIESRKEEVDETIIVAHSMGGLIAKACLNNFAGKESIEKVKKLITMGTPWAGAPSAYKALRHGDGFPRDRVPTILSAKKAKEIVYNFASVYQLLPNMKYMHNYDKKSKLPFTEYDGKVMKSWEDVYSDIYMPLLKNNDVDFVDAFNSFVKLINADINIEHHEIIGYGKGTYCAFERDKKEKTKAIFGDGDGTVPLTSAESSTPNKYYVNGGHQFLPNNSIVLDIVRGVIHGDDIKNTEDYLVHQKFKEKYISNFKAKVIKVACPVLVSLSDSNHGVLYGSAESLLNENDNNWFDDQSNRDDIEVTYIDDTTYILLPYEDEKELESKMPDKIVIEAYDEGATSISIEEYKEGKVTEINTYDSFIIDQNKTVEVTLPLKSSDSRLSIIEDGKVQSKEPKTVKPTEIDKVIPPKTKLNIEGEKQVKLEKKFNTYIVGGEVNLNIMGVIQGTNPVSDTYYSINDSKFNLIFKENMVKLTLNEGENTLKIFSVDSAGNEESTQTYTLYYVENVIPKIIMRFYPKAYKLEYEQPNKEMYSELKVRLPKVSFVVEPSEGVNKDTNMISYRGLTREVKIEYTNVFNDKEVLYSKIDEKLITAVLGTQGTAEQLNELLSGIGVTPPMTVRITKTDETGTPKSIQTKYIQKAKEIVIDQKVFFIEIVRDVRHKVSFQNLAEDIKVDEKDQHIFKFKVLDDTVEVKNLDIHSEIKMSFKSGEEFSKELSSYFDEKDDNYQVVLNIDDIKPYLNQYWSKDSVSKIDLIIEEVDKAKDKHKALRVQPITIR
ncbi:MULTISPECIES: lipase/acyltransferase domain-containing protein [Bacillus]|uniref:lipase/acyltransferase domain-containing protein n=1 Tax=Bacillus TaxID=1386 RepID=UPI001F0B2515|nr:acyltransferase [Bacillus thuringiensis]